MNRKIRKIQTYPPVIVAALVTLTLIVAAVASISTEAEQQSATQPQTERQAVVMQTLPMASLALEQTAPEPAHMSAIHSWDFGSEDSRMLLKIAMAEAEGESVKGKALVMLVVLNRVLDRSFPNTIEDVIFQKNQFSPVVEGGRYWTTEPDEGCYEALALVESG